MVRIERGVDGPLVFRAPLWVGDGTFHDDGRVVVERGVVTALGAAVQVEVPSGAEEFDAGWVGPGLVDAHVHLAFGDSDHVLAGGVVAVRDLGAPPADAARWRKLDAPRVAVAGPLLTAPGGYPSRSWGSAGFAAFIDDADQATASSAGWRHSWTSSRSRSSRGPARCRPPTSWRPSLPPRTTAAGRSPRTR